MKSLKRILSLLLIFMGVALFSSCSDDKEDSAISIPTTNSIPVGSSFSFGLSGNWSSSNNFVASVDNDGNVKAEHVGECIISNGNHNCIVTVTPKSNLIKEPITEWGISKPQLISKCGTDYQESGTAIGYKTNSNIAPMIMYSFDSYNRLSSSVVMVKTAYTSELVDFLIERYRPVTMDGYDYYFVNGYSSQSISTVIGMGLYKYDKDYWMVLYMPYSSSSRSSEAIDLASNLFNIAK